MSVSGMLARFWRRTPMIFQMEATECGAASLGMVLGHHGRHEPLEILRVACGVSRNGSVASRIIKAAQTFGLHGTGYNLPLEKLDALPVPSILFWNFSHFVVYTGRRGKHYHINDPGEGPRRFTRDEFERHYAGVVLAFHKTEHFTPAGRRRGVMATLLPLLLRVKMLAAIIIWAGLLMVLPGLISPTLLNIFVDEILNQKTSWLYPLIVAGGLVMLAQVALTFVTQAVLRRGGMLLAADNTLRMMTHLFRLPMEFFSQRYAADLQHRVALNRTVAQSVTTQLAPNCLHLFTATFFLLLMARISPQLAAIAVLASALDVVALLSISRYRQILCQSLVVLEMKLANLSMNGISMMESLRAGGREGTFFTEWSSVLAEYTAQSRAASITSSLLGLLPTLFFGINSVLVLCVGADAIIRGDMTLGAMMAFQVLMGGFMLPVNHLVKDSAAMQMLRGDVERVEDVFRYPAETRFAPSGEASGEASEPGAQCEQGESLRPAVQAPLREGASGRLELRDVTFGYGPHEPPTVRGVSFTLQPGQRVALVGTSGSGKSTVARIASGLYAPSGGQVLLDGVPFERCTKEAVHEAISMVDQSSMLFSGTVADNLTLFDSTVKPDVLHAGLRDAMILEELGSRGGDALQLDVQEMGANFSGGQRQRLEIARALIRQTPILILDEAMSALDPVTEELVDAAIRRRRVTCLMVAHRLSTVRDCDEILFMERGEIIERGTHDTLMAQNGGYARLMHVADASAPAPCTAGEGEA